MSYTKSRKHTLIVATGTSQWLRRIRYDFVFGYVPIHKATAATAAAKKKATASYGIVPVVGPPDIFKQQPPPVPGRPPQDRHILKRRKLERKQPK